MTRHPCIRYIITCSCVCFDPYMNYISICVKGNQAPRHQAPSLSPATNVHISPTSLNPPRSFLITAELNTNERWMLYWATETSRHYHPALVTLLSFMGAYAPAMQEHTGVWWWFTFLHCFLYVMQCVALMHCLSDL